MLAGVVALALWCRPGFGSLRTWFGDNDSARYAFTRASGAGVVARDLISFHARKETIQSAVIWFGRVPTEANISDFPSRSQSHPLLTEELNQSQRALDTLTEIVVEMKSLGPWGIRC